MVITPEEAKEIEASTRDQSDNMNWRSEKRKRLTVSRVGSILKMRRATKRSKKVEEMLYSKFKGNAATRYGLEKEDMTKELYVTYQRQRGHPDLTAANCGLFISLEYPWLGATPDGVVTDPSDTSQPLGLVEIKNPYAARQQTLSEACTRSGFCLELNKEDN